MGLLRDKWTVVVVVLGIILSIGSMAVYNKITNESFIATPTTPPPSENYCNLDSDCACGVHKDTGNCFYGNKYYITSNLLHTLTQCPDFCSGISGNLEVKCITNQCQQVVKKTAFQGTIWQYEGRLCPSIGDSVWLMNKNWKTCDANSPDYSNCLFVKCDKSSYCLISDKNRWYMDLSNVVAGEYNLWLQCLSGSSPSYSKIIPITVESGKTKTIDYYAQGDKICIDGVCSITSVPEEQVDIMIKMIIQQIFQQICQENPSWCK